MKLYKTVITIISDYNPAYHSIEDLARDAECGDSFCYDSTTTQIDSSELEGDGIQEFFGINQDEDEDEDEDEE